MSHFDELIQSAKAEASTPRLLYATVNSTNPLNITIDGDDNPLEIEPSTTVDGILPGDKVICTLQNDELIVTGIVDGDVDYVEEFKSGISAAQSAADAAHVAANGKNTVYRSQASQLPTDVTFAKGDIWFDTANDNKPSVYDGTAWVESPFGDAAIGNLDVGHLTGGVMEADVQWAGKAFFGDPEGARIEAGAGGLQVIDSDGGVQSKLSPTGSTFSGDVIADDVQVDGALKITGSAEVAANSVMKLSIAETPPAAAPVVSPTWASVTLKNASGATIQPCGVTVDPSTGYWIAGVAGTNSGGDSIVTITRHNATTGAYISTVGAAVSEPGYIGILNGVGYVLYFGMEGIPERYYLYLAGTNGTTVKGPSVGALGTMAIGYGSATQLAARSGTKIYLWNPSTNAYSLTDTAPGLTGAGITLTAADFGGTARYVTSDGGSVTPLASGQAVVADSFPLAAATAVCGLGYDAGRFWTAHSDGKVYLYDGAKVPPTPISYSWADSKSTGTGLHETATSPGNLGTALKSRARIAVTIASRVFAAGADSVDSARIYAGGHLQGTTSGTTLTIATPSTTGAAPGSLPAFPVGVPGRIVSDSGLAISADGSIAVNTIVTSGAAALNAAAIAGRSVAGYSRSGRWYQTGTVPAEGTAKIADFTYGYIAVPAADYPRTIIMGGKVDVQITAGNRWAAVLGYDTTDPGSTSTTAPENQIDGSYMHNPGTATAYLTGKLAGAQYVAANTPIWVRVFLVRTSGTATVQDSYGRSVWTYAVES